MNCTHANAPTIVISIILWLTAGCGNPPTNVGSPSDEIAFSTDKASYAPSDTLTLALSNNTKSDAIIGMRCATYLEMFYQKHDTSGWGDTLWFPYMSLRCVTLLDTVKVNSTFRHRLPAGIFYATGTFRLTVRFHDPLPDSSRSAVSNSFTIQ